MGNLRRLAPIFILVVTLGLLGQSHTVWAQTPTPQASKHYYVVTWVIEPFVIKQGSSFTGFSADLWDALAKRLNLDYEWVEVNSVDEMRQRVHEGKVDFAVGRIVITADGEKSMDYSVTIMQSGLQILVGEERQGFLKNTLTGIFHPELLQVMGVGVLVLLIMAHIIWLVERNGNEAIPKAYLPGIWESMWYALSTVATLEYGAAEKPRSILKRIVAMVMVVLGIVLIAQFTAAITASLTVQQLGGTINGPGDLSGHKVATVSLTTAAKYLDNHGIGYEGVSRITEAYPLLESGQVDAIVFDAPVLEYYAANQANGKMRVVGPVFNTQFYAFALQEGSPMRKTINQALLTMMEDGSYQQIYQKWFGETK